MEISPRDWRKAARSTLPAGRRYSTSPTARKSIEVVTWNRAQQRADLPKRAVEQKLVASANLATLWEIHGQKKGTNITPGQTFAMEWGLGQVIPLEEAI